MRTLAGHQAAVTRLAYAPGDALTLASASPDGTVRLWNPATGQNWATFQQSGHGGHCLAFAPDGSLLAADGPEAAVTLWDVAMQERLAAYHMTHPGGSFGESERPVRAVAFSPDGKVLVAGRVDHEWRNRSDLAFWDVGLPEHISTLGWFGGVGFLAASPEANGLAVAGPERGMVDLWVPEGRAGRTRASIRIDGFVSCLTFSGPRPGGVSLLAVGVSERVELWETSGWTCAARLAGHRGPVHSVSFSPDGRQLLSGSEDGTVRLWDVGSAHERVCLDWQLGPVSAVAFAPDGVTAAAAGASPDIVIWDLD